MGGGSQKTYDKAYNKRLATLMEGADERTQMLFNDYYNGDQREYDNKVASAGLELLPAQTELAGLQLQSQSDLLPLQTDVSKAQLGLDLQSSEYKSGIMGKFYEAIGQNDPAIQASQAGTDMAEAYSAARTNDAMSQKRMGLYKPKATGLSLSEARDIGGARTAARKNAIDANINQLAMGLQI